MYKVRRKLFSQNFLRDRKLVSKLLGRSSIGKNDLVLEIGPGKGIITGQLVQRAQYVLTVEIDSHWYNYLEHMFNDKKNLILYHKDFLDFKLPSLPYKVFANIPFAIEGRIIRKLIDTQNPPEDCYLVMMKELAYRLAAPYKENMFSVMHKPWFDFSIFHHFRQTDFEPVPNIGIVMLRFTKRREPLLQWSERKRYRHFIEQGFGHGQPVKDNLKKLYGRQKVLQALREGNLPRNIQPSFISPEQWVALYNTLENLN